MLLKGWFRFEPNGLTCGIKLKLIQKGRIELMNTHLDQADGPHFDAVGEALYLLHQEMQKPKDLDPSTQKGY